MPTVIILTSGTSWPVPGDFNAADNKIELIGGGGGGAGGTDGTDFVAGKGGGAAGGGEIRTLTNYDPGAGPVTYAIGAAGTGGARQADGTDGGDTTWGSTPDARAKGGSKGLTAGGGGAGGTGGTGGTGRNGGTGGAGAAESASDGGGGGGGGGSAGTTAVGGTGSAGGNPAGGAGGAGGADNGGAGGTSGGGTGGSGTDWEGTHGSGGGGGGGDGETPTGGGDTGGAAGSYGGGGAGGGGGRDVFGPALAGGNGQGGIIVITYTVAAPTYEQSTFRGRNDDGSESAATWKAAAGTDWSQVGVILFRVRFLIKCTGLGEAGIKWSFEHRLDTGGGYGAWTATSITSTNLVIKDSAFLTNGDDTTDQGLGSGTFTADNNGVIEATEGDAMTAVVDEEFAIEGVFKTGLTLVALKAGDKFQVRVRKNLAAIGTYTLTPTITIIEPVLSADRLPMLGVS